MESQDPIPTAQAKFDAAYISSSEICAELQVTRATVMAARQRNLLPDAVVVNGMQIYLWEREAVRPYLDAWKVVLTARRGDAV